MVIEIDSELSPNMPANESDFNVSELAQTFAVAKQFVKELTWPACVYLYGELGAGKTSFCQGVIAALGNQTAVTSPTYNLLQEYPVPSGTVYHMDLFRLNDPSELEYLALPDLWHEDAIFLVEWPDRGTGFLPEPTHIIHLKLDESSSHSGRSIKIQTV